MTNQQRRAAKRRARADKTAAAAPPNRNNAGPGPEPSLAEWFAAQHSARGAGRAEELPPAERARRLVVAGAMAAGPSADRAALDHLVDELVMFRGTAAAGDTDLADQAAARMLLASVAAAYESGWQPADLVHVVRRGKHPGAVRLATATIAEQARRTGAADRAPAEWLAQLDGLDIGDDGLDLLTQEGGEDWTAAGWHQRQRTNLWDGWHDTLALIGVWSALAPLPRLVPPPSAWGRHRPPPRPAGPATPSGAPAHGHDPKMLTRIRALLAKAEGSSFPEEADAFTSKAQDLMTRYAIDEALLDRESGQIGIDSRRFHLDNPYAPAKAQLLGAVATANRVKAIWDDQHGMATVVGPPVDLDLVEMLFTSLLVQATRTMTDAGAVTENGRRLDRSPAFRRAFLLSYAVRIGERLAAAGEHAQQEVMAGLSAELVPVLARRQAAVDSEFTRLFPSSRKVGPRSVDARGWHAGRAAADRAVLSPARQVDRGDRT